MAMPGRMPHPLAASPLPGELSVRFVAIGETEAISAELSTELPEPFRGNVRSCRLSGVSPASPGSQFVSCGSRLGFGRAANDGLGRLRLRNPGGLEAALETVQQVKGNSGTP
jgi:hypothetical protein